MKNLIVIAHPDKKSFCYSGIMKTVKETLKSNKEEVYVIDLYKENITFEFMKDKVQKYKQLIFLHDSLILLYFYVLYQLKYQKYL